MCCTKRHSTSKTKGRQQTDKVTVLGSMIGGVSAHSCCNGKNLTLKSPGTTESFQKELQKVTAIFN